jgi:sulfatase modifying factor 1
LFAEFIQKVGASVHHNVSDQSQQFKKMAWIPTGTFSMGCDEASFIDGRPIHKVHINGFWLDKTLVTNQQFADFVRASHYVTIAERKPQAKDFPGAPAEKLVPGALVFTTPKQPVSLKNYYQWWRYVPGASWKHPGTNCL